jgi:hypothetical protein
MRKALVLSAGLIAIYLLVSHATDAGKLLVAGGRDALPPVIKAFQGR